MAHEGNITVALDITIDEDLIDEGISRELISRIQNIRKTSGFEVTDIIKIVDYKCPSSGMEKKNLWSNINSINKFYNRTLSKI